MGRFDRAIRILAPTGHRLFVRMAETAQAMPMALHVRTDVCGAIELGQRTRIGSALWRLTHSRRYLRACAEPGAMRHDLDGWPVQPVSAKHQEWARAELARRDAAAQHPGLVALPGSSATLELP